MKQFEFPLQWLNQQPKTKNPKRSQFGNHSPSKAGDYLIKELQSLGAKNCIISSNLQVRTKEDGLTREEIVNVTMGQPRDIKNQSSGRQDKFVSTAHIFSEVSEFLTTDTIIEKYPSDMLWISKADHETEIKEVSEMYAKRIRELINKGDEHESEVKAFRERINHVYLPASVRPHIINLFNECFGVKE